MEIHTVHGAVNSVKDFLLHIAIITIGILIALSLEGILEWNHHRTLIREAQSNLAVEIKANRKTMEIYLQEIQKRQEQLSLVVSTMEALQQKRNVPTNLEMSYTFHTFDSAAWNTASASGAVTFMDYNDLQRYTDIYNGQQAFQVLQAEALRNVADLASRLQLLDTRQTGLAHKHLKAWPEARLEEIERQARGELLTLQLLEALGKSTLDAYAKASPPH